MKATTVRYITATEAKNRFGEVIREAYQEEHHLIVQRDGIPVIAIMPVQEYERLVEARIPVQDASEAHVIKATPSHGAPSPLVPLTGFSEQELTALARAVVAPEHQNQLSRALEKNRNAALSAEERLSLDELLDDLVAEIDQVALLKARALYTLQLRHSAVNNAT
jgi:prevent-host-death family protein